VAVQNWDEQKVKNVGSFKPTHPIHHSPFNIQPSPIPILRNRVGGKVGCDFVRISPSRANRFLHRLNPQRFRNGGSE